MFGPERHCRVGNGPAALTAAANGSVDNGADTRVQRQTTRRANTLTERALMTQTQNGPSNATAANGHAAASVTPARPARDPGSARTLLIIVLTLPVTIVALVIAIEIFGLFARLVAH